MDLLGDYGSDSGSEPSSPTIARAGPSTSAAPAPPPASTFQPLSTAPATAQPLGNALSSLPLPTSERAPLFSGLPMPAIRRKRITAKFSCGIDYGDAPQGATDDKDDALPASKRLKSGPSKGASLSSFLPPPKNPGRMKSNGNGGGGNSGPVLGSGFGGLDDDIVPGAEDLSGMFLGRGDGDAREGEGGGVYDAYGSGQRTIGGAGPSSAQPQSQSQSQSHHIRGFHEGQEYIYDTITGQYYYPDNGAAQHAQQASADAMLEAALAAESRGGGGGIQFKEVSGAQLRYMDPGQRAELNALRSAFGDDYESRLKSDAAKVGAVSKLAKKKHQLASLYVQAKDQELEDMEKRATGAKTKAETQRKYGW